LGLSWKSTLLKTDMGIRSFLAKPLAWFTHRQTLAWSRDPVETQQKVFTELVSKAQNTAFGAQHSFVAIKSHSDFVKNVPIRDYEELKSYFERTASW
jgi:hypothetical protein